MTDVTLQGSCLCGAVRYEVAGKATRFYHCHCSRCRKATGTGHASNLFLQPGTLSWLSGEELVTSFKVPQATRFANTFCKTCGGRVPRQAAGSDLVMIQPQAVIFAGSRAGWSCDSGEMPAYPQYPPP